ncbi:MAG: hypothetical protein LBE92_01245 [Chryseobacterium sp.]|jgi:hypothetical protein|uniref:hypothetical protein n=1 Tax=Chryseobacterium sp. TaxID=1871047 RepID=UPI002835DEEC|nr:hypothetical protein [Chryseobacterium sp.]MDR2234724.1 hypothetical protein [Chryseobacterium sp.]
MTVTEIFLIGKTIEEAEELLGQRTVRMYSSRYAFELKRYCFGILKRRLHISTHRGVIYDCHYRIDL